MTYVPSNEQREDYRIVELKYLDGHSEYAVEVFGSSGGVKQWSSVLDYSKPGAPKAVFATKERAEKFIASQVVVEVKVL